MKIPDYILEGYARIKAQFPEAVIIGGALRDALYDRPIKDVDVFVKHTSTEDILRRLGKTLPPPPASCTFPGGCGSCDCDLSSIDAFLGFRPYVNLVIPDALEGDYADWSGGDVRAVIEVRYTENDPPFQIISTDLPCVASLLRDRCDLSFCQASFDGTLFEISPAFYATELTRRVTFHGREDQRSRTQTRIERLRQKYPDFEFPNVIEPGFQEFHARCAL
jgi:hypothetical protein